VAVLLFCGTVQRCDSRYGCTQLADQVWQAVLRLYGVQSAVSGAYLALRGEVLALLELRRQVCLFTVKLGHLYVKIFW
jgi:hypothetical protein